MKGLLWCAASAFTAFLALLITATVLYGSRPTLPLGWNVAIGSTFGLAVLLGAGALTWHLATASRGLARYEKRRIRAREYDYART